MHSCLFGKMFTFRMLPFLLLPQLLESCCFRFGICLSSYELNMLGQLFVVNCLDKAAVGNWDRPLLAGLQDCSFGCESLNPGSLKLEPCLQPSSNLQEVCPLRDQIPGLLPSTESCSVRFAPQTLRIIGVEKPSRLL